MAALASPSPQSCAPAATVRGGRDDRGRPVVVLAGRLDSATTGAVWNEALGLAGEVAGAELVVDASELEHCDGAGAGLLLALQ